VHRPGRKAHYLSFLYVYFRFSRASIASKHVYKKGSVTLDGPDPHKISRKMSDPDVHHLPPLFRQLSSATTLSSKSGNMTNPPGSPTVPGTLITFSFVV